MGKVLLIVMVITTTGKIDYLNSTQVTKVSSMEVCRLAEKAVQNNLEEYSSNLHWEIKTSCRPLSVMFGQKN